MLLEAVPAAADGWVSAAFASPGFPSGKVPSQVGILDSHIEEFAEIGYSAALTRTHAHLPHIWQLTHPITSQGPTTATFARLLAQRQPPRSTADFQSIASDFSRICRGHLAADSLDRYVSATPPTSWAG